ncbi:hypothetical protein NDU88_002493 [Pleurodeles waltl]|uniref:Uncharacterized protein n=1 Tax=Pleurodeles waltl TaxID=8319 RepID=A0AAV7TKT5_PLEWA|nr:hypothetical protein NDU88_002493 [Pleurodeles waltl]
MQTRWTMFSLQDPNKRQLVDALVLCYGSLCRSDGIFRAGTACERVASGFHANASFISHSAHTCRLLPSNVFSNYAALDYRSGASFQLPLYVPIQAYSLCAFILIDFKPDVIIKCCNSVERKRVKVNEIEYDGKDEDDGQSFVLQIVNNVNCITNIRCEYPIDIVEVDGVKVAIVDDGFWCKIHSGLGT